MPDAHFQHALSQAASRVETSLKTLLPAESEGRIAQAMRYAALSGGKRLRAFLVLESAAMFDVPAAQANATAAAIECLHAYSLVHDDLPAMDNDDLRRGQPTLHIKWDDATAVLAGDALQTVAFEILAGMDAGADIRLALISSLAIASGGRGMVQGQDMDVAAETAAVPLDLTAITRLQTLKTGALIRWSAAAGALLANQDPAPLHAYANALGLAFQIRDDILDIEGDAETAGKRLRKDTEAGKATFVSLLGLEGAKSRAVELVAQANASLAPYGDRAENLRSAAQYTITRAT
ncbi:MAG: polyprenyl synthetase family protein [Rhodobacteraceae bacterium]|nr:polyprenyl synthetase family protein [Paracoccaceae bacterium]